jgi:hypothetical protein
MGACNKFNATRTAYLEQNLGLPTDYLEKDLYSTTQLEKARPQCPVISLDECARRCRMQPNCRKFGYPFRAPFNRCWWHMPIDSHDQCIRLQMEGTTSIPLDDSLYELTYNLELAFPSAAAGDGAGRLGGVRNRRAGQAWRLSAEQTFRELNAENAFVGGEDEEISSTQGYDGAVAGIAGGEYNYRTGSLAKDVEEAVLGEDGSGNVEQRRVPAEYPHTHAGSAGAT